MSGWISALKRKSSFSKLSMKQLNVEILCLTVIIELIGKIAIFYEKKFNINRHRIAILKSLGSNGFRIIEK